MFNPEHSLRESVNKFTLTDDPSELQHHLVGVLLHQMSAKVGLKKHGQRAKEVLFTEFLQLHDMGVFSPIHRRNLSSTQIKNTLRAISVIKEKRDGTLKGRTCADGRKQRDWCTKHETSSPTVHTDSFMLVTAIEAKERRDVGTGDVQGACLHAKQKDFTVLKFVNEQVDIMCEIDKKCIDYVTYEKQNKVLYLMLSKALCGTLTASLLWFELLTSTLIHHNFKLNPHICA